MRDDSVARRIVENLRGEIEYCRKFDGHHHTLEKEMAMSDFAVQECGDHWLVRLSPTQNETVVYLGTAEAYKIDKQTRQVWLLSLE